jgi:GNAT superfamily N-acetyltransferase
MSDDESVDQDQVDLQEAVLGYNILVDGEYVGGLEAVPGRLEHIEVAPHMEGQGVGRAAFRAFIELSKEHDERRVVTNNAVNPKMEHILESEGFEENPEGIGWVKEV